MANDALTVDGAIATLTLPGPLDAACVERLADHCARVAADDAVRVLLLQAEAAVWAGWSEEAERRAEEGGLIGDPFGVFAAVPQPTLAVVEGAVREAGLELALCADIRLAGAGASFALAGVGAGAFPIAGGLARLARTLGRARALELVVGGATIDAATALRWGLVSAVADDARAEAHALAARIAQRGPLATRFAKEALRRGPEMPLEQALRYEADLSVLLQTSADRAEGVRAFLEKRAPQFHGR